MGGVFSAAKGPPKAVIHYIRPDGDYEGWALHVWGGALQPTDWNVPLQPKSVSELSGALFEIDGVGSINFIAHRGDEKDIDSVVDVGSEVWAVEGCPTLFRERPDLTKLFKGGFDTQRAFWLAPGLVALPSKMAKRPSDVVVLHASYTAALKITEVGVEGAALTKNLRRFPQEATLPAEVLSKFPHLRKYVAFEIDTGDDARVMLKAQLAVEVLRDGVFADATGVQIAGVIDEMCTYEGPLGVTFGPETVTLALWAPTASLVYMQLFAAAGPDAEHVADVPMMEGPRGEWTASASRGAWEGMYFVYRLRVFCPWTNKIEDVVSSDPYSHSLAANGSRTHIADLSSADAKPERWDEIELPAACHPVDMSIYELHVRDFSISDKTVPEALRGTYSAFVCKEAVGGGIAHLAALAKAGLTHVQLLPVYDFGSVDENKSQWRSPILPAGTESLHDPPADSELQQELLEPILDHDGFNWGYDPQHYSAPEGSYASDPNGLARVREFRNMVAGLARMNLRVVMDVVYNHVFSSGPTSPTSVLDKVVPGYYLRRSLDGSIEASTCMNNTASEHAMFDRLIVDSVTHWVKAYKVSAFRFDLMGHLMLSTMLRVRAAVDRLTLEHDGIDGKSVYLYGEGWDFGEVARRARGINGSQLNLGGTGIGSFNDRIREAVVGGNPFGDPRVQGFATGMGTLHNGFVETAGADHQAKVLRQETERLIVGLAGNLAEYTFVGANGAEVSGRDAGCLGFNCGYATSPEETVNYVSAHDNETLFDMMVYKVKAGQGPEEYARRSILCTALVAYAQGLPFFHAGDDTLRSKSLDRDSYNSGDHFNVLDWTFSSNNFGVGLPPKGKNGDKWGIMRPLLADKAAIAPTPDIIARTAAAFREILRVRYSSPLFRLRTAEDVASHVRFFNCGPMATPGVVVMELSDDCGTCDGGPSPTPLDTTFQKIVVIFNARPEPYVHEEPALMTRTEGLSMKLHPVLRASVDDVIRSAAWPPGGPPYVPQCTAAVFVAPRLQA